MTNAATGYHPVRKAPIQWGLWCGRLRHFWIILTRARAIIVSEGRLFNGGFGAGD